MILLKPTTCPITQTFGENPALYPSTHGHMGIDYGCPEGTPIKAAATGLVVFADLDPETERNPKAGYGNYVKLRHDGGEYTVYGHLSSLAVTLGETVRTGQIVGASGNTGRSTAPHLHFEYRTTATNAIDPAPFLVDTPPTELFDMILTVDGDGLRVRTAPNLGAGIVRHLHPGDKEPIFGVAGSDIWLQVKDGYVKYLPAWERLEDEE